MGTPPRQLQVVDVACGFDGRAFRLNFPANTIFWELDRAEVLDVKSRHLATLNPIPQITCLDRICVPADLIADNWEQKLVDTGGLFLIEINVIEEGLLPLKELDKKNSKKWKSCNVQALLLFIMR